jgi:YggT family protein
MEIVQGLMNILGGITSLYMILIFIRIMLTWFSGTNYGRAFTILTGVTDPYLNWFRRFPALRVANLDLSPIAALAILSVVNSIFITLGRYGRISLGLILALVFSAVWSVISFLLGFSLVILTLRLIAYLTNRDVYGSFWRIIDMISQPVLYRISRLIFGKRLVRYLTGLLSSIAVLLILWAGLGFLARMGTDFLIRLPF